MVLPGFALPWAAELLAAVQRVVAIAPFRQMQTPGGGRMSVAMSNCGALGWVTDERGYRYQGHDPLTHEPWPPMPPPLQACARAAAAAAGHAGFDPDACVINRYEPRARMALHQDRNERDFTHPIVSVSLGLPAVFLFGGAQRSDRAVRVPLQHGDVVVWGGATRRFFHGIAPLRDGVHALLGAVRINLTFRVAGP